MYVPTPTESHPARDPDLLEQARPGHGVPSQDPDPAAQFALSNREARNESKTVYMGAGVLIGAASGAARRHYRRPGQRRDSIAVALEWRPGGRKTA
jgi:hypothetical protein